MSVSSASAPLKFSVKDLDDRCACSHAMSYVAEVGSLPAAWASCSCGHWLLWAIRRFVDFSSEEERLRIADVLLEIAQATKNVPGVDAEVLALLDRVKSARQLNQDKTLCAQVVNLTRLFWFDTPFLALKSHMLPGNLLGRAARIVWCANDLSAHEDVQEVTSVLNWTEHPINSLTVADIVRKYYPKVAE